MKRTRVLAGLAALAVPAGIIGIASGCGEDEVFRSTDASTFDGPIPARATDGASGGGRAPVGCGEAGAGPPRALVSYAFDGGGEVVVVGLDTGSVDGRLAADGGIITSSLGTEPWALGIDTDIVTRLDPREPWKATASWNVRGADTVIGASANAGPIAVVPVSCAKAYVLRENRDQIAIIDPSQAAGGVPTGWIDLSPLRGEALGPLGVTSAVYVPSSKRVYVLVANDTTDTEACITAPSIVAIDVETDAIVSLGGTARGGAIALVGSRPTPRTPLVYDGAAGRLFVLESGCRPRLDDGGVGAAITKRGVEQVDLATGTVKTALAIDDQDPPRALAFVSSSLAALAFGGRGNGWDPHDAVLGPAVDVPIDHVAPDGRGAFVATGQVDGGSAVLVFSPADAGPITSSIVVRNPSAEPAATVVGLEPWK